MGSIKKQAPIKQKVRYVQGILREGEEHRSHRCHWPGCEQQVPPAVWGCRKHWYALPYRFRQRIWAAYRRGQEIDRRPSREYVRVALEVREWIKAHQLGSK